MIYDGSPFLAKQVSSKYSEMSAKKVRQDLSENHYRALSQDYIQNLSQKVGELIEEEERHIQYTLPAKVIDCQIVSIGRDGTTIYVREDGYRETMSGTISFYNVNRERIYTIYLAQAPQYGKECFNFRMERMINIVKSYLPINTTYIGLADGASDNWSFLDVHTKVSIIDYWHATEYLTLASSAASRSSYEKKKWLEQAREQLKNKKGAAKTILGEMKKFRNRKNLGKKVKDDLQKAITYFTNHTHQMSYAAFLEAGYPIGSGVTEAACKVIVKQRLCQSGMKWKIEGAQKTLSIRSLQHTQGRWEQFWSYIDQYGYS